SSEKTLTRKLYEALLAFKIEHSLSKEQILELYVNQIYLGQRAYGFAAPVKVVASRENDLTGGFYRPMTVHRVRAGIDATGAISGWDQVCAAKSIMKDTPFEAMGIRNGIDGN
ncbi:transglycosylase domain-containing protein, partial [Klebsiella pneumoniae]|uniref:transglycosylase domain-containing protein n=1 Tax=Klebsiella pneumoniae TaxID=573 RepID=UPI003A810BCD